MPNPSLESRTLLALDPGTKDMGVAVLEDTELVDYRVKTFRTARSASALLEEGSAYLRGLLTEVLPGTVVIEKPFLAPTRRSALLNLLVEELRKEVRAGHLRLREHEPRTVRQVLLDDPRATKRDVARHVVSRYPELRVRFHPGDFWRERYWSHVFDAVALGLAELELASGLQRR